jgi:phospholipid-binding lipoprotein MlaA
MKAFQRTALTLAATLSFTLLTTTAVANHKTQAKASPTTQDMPVLPEAMTPSINIDPYKGFNKAMFQFNQVFSGLFIEPWAYLYENAVWSPVQHGVSNVYNNLHEVTNIPNDLLQGKVTYALNDFWRLLINSTVGIGGIFDVAKHMGLKKHNTDFGQTLATWGATQSRYLVLPFIGPSTFRDAFAMPFDTFGMSVWPYIHPHSTAYWLYAGKELSQQAALLPVYRTMHGAFNPYVFMRSSYLQNRNAAIAKNAMPYNEFIQSEGFASAQHTAPVPAPVRISKNHPATGGKLGKLGKLGKS